MHEVHRVARPPSVTDPGAPPSPLSPTPPRNACQTRPPHVSVSCIGCVREHAAREEVRAFDTNDHRRRISKQAFISVSPSTPSTAPPQDALPSRRFPHPRHAVRIIATEYRKRSDGRPPKTAPTTASCGISGAFRTWEAL